MRPQIKSDFLYILVVVIATAAGVHWSRQKERSSPIHVRCGIGAMTFVDFWTTNNEYTTVSVVGTNVQMVGGLLTYGPILAITTNKWVNR